MKSVPRAEVMEVPSHQVLSTLCHQTKNLYNRANYICKRHLHKQNTIYSYYELDRILKAEDCYKILPAHTAQHTLKILIRNWTAFFQARKEWKKDPHTFLGTPRSPHYKPPKGELVAIISNQQATSRV